MKNVEEIIREIEEREDEPKACILDDIWDEFMKVGTSDDYLGRSEKL